MFLLRRIRQVDPEKSGTYRSPSPSHRLTITICCYSEMEFVEIMAGLDQNTPDSLIEEHVNKIKEEIV